MIHAYMFDAHFVHLFAVVPVYLVPRFAKTISSVLPLPICVPDCVEFTRACSRLMLDDTCVHV